VKQTVTTKKKQSTIGLLRPVLLFIPLYILLIFLLPASKTVMRTYSLEPFQYHILLLLVTLPYMLVWISACLAYVRLRQYTKLLKKTPEGGDYWHITRGIMYLAYGLPIVAILSLLINSVGNHVSELKAASIIMVNYLSLLVPLVAYSTLRKGTHGLVERNKLRFSLNDMRTIVIALVLIGVAYCYFTFRKLNLDSIGSADNPYYLPAWLMITTIIVPYLYAWFSGLLAAYELVLFGRQVQGVLYRQAVRWVASGVAGVVAGGVALQYLRTVVPRTGHLSINTAFLFAFTAYVILIVGFVLIIIGASKLKRIEEV